MFDLATLSSSDVERSVNATQRRPPSQLALQLGRVDGGGQQRESERQQGPRRLGLRQSVRRRPRRRCVVVMRVRVDSALALELTDAEAQERFRGLVQWSSRWTDAC